MKKMRSNAEQEANTLPKWNFARNMMPSDTEIVKGRGIYVYDNNGKEYMDLTSQTLNLNLGHRHPAIMKAVIDKLSEDGFTYYVSPRFGNRHVSELAERLVSLAPGGLNRVNLHLCNGSDANEDAIKRARKYYNGSRMAIVSFKGSFLGTSCESISASGGNFYKEDCVGGSKDYIFIDPVMPNRIPKGSSIEEQIQCRLEEFEAIAKTRKDICAIIMELVPFNAGVIVLPKEYVRGIERICRENDIAMLVDEVQTAFGWCGDVFASNVYAIKPDVITLGKGLTAGFPALAATVFKEKYDVLNGGTSENTFGAQTLGCVAALANMNYLTSSGIMEEIPEKHGRFMSHLNRMKEAYPFIGDVRGIGLMFGIDFVFDDGSPDRDINIDVYRAAFDRGLMVNVSTSQKGMHNVISIKPPLTITVNEIDEAMGRFDDATRSVSDARGRKKSP